MAVDFSQATGLVDSGGFRGVFGEYFDDSALNSIQPDVEDLWEYADINMTSFKNEVKDLLVEFLRRNVLIAISGGVKPKP